MTHAATLFRRLLLPLGLAGAALTTAGPLDLNTGALKVRGDLINADTLAPGTSTVTFSGAADQLLTPGAATLYQLLVNKPTAGANTLRLAGDLKVSNLLGLTSGLVSTQNGSVLSTLRLSGGATLSGKSPGRYVIGQLEIMRSAVSGASVDFGHGAVPATTYSLTLVQLRVKS